MVTRRKLRDPLFWAADAQRFRTRLVTLSVYDAGCGIGSDFEELTKTGAQYIGVDSSEGMITEAQVQHPEGTFFVGDITQMRFEQQFGGLWAVASLLHTPPSSIERVLAHLGQTLVRLAPAFIVMREGTGSAIVTNEQGSREFFYYDADRLADHLQNAGYQINDIRSDPRGIFGVHTTPYLVCHAMRK
jgi:SAM-dependent methyltransferase